MSITAAQARPILPVDYRGPVVHENLDAIEAPAHVVIIDGILDADQRLETAEVLSAIERGILVDGASSTGALLAVELEHAGMNGHGRVFETLRALRQHSATLDLQELVTALYVAGEFMQLTIPLVEALAYCHKAGLGMERLTALARALCGLPLEARSWVNIQDVAAQSGVILPSALSRVNTKHDDARALLESIAAPYSSK